MMIRYLKAILYGLAVVVCVIGSFISPLLIYLSLLVIGGGVIYLMAAVENIYITATAMPGKDEEIQDTDKENTPGLSREELQLIHKISEYVKQNYSKGHSIEKITSALTKSGYNPSFIEMVINDLNLEEHKPSDLPNLEVYHSEQEKKPTEQQSLTNSKEFDETKKELESIKKRIEELKNKPEDKENNPTCDECGKTFKTEGILRNHKRLTKH